MRRPTRRTLAAALLAAFACGSCSSCKKGDPSRTDGGASLFPAASVQPANEGGTPKPGMVFVPPGVLLAGTATDRAPRIADEEMAGVPVPMRGFYIDLLPWPNEPNAIPTSNVTREEAEQLCASKGKRLCSELEWERACKGPSNTTYEYGDPYRAGACGTGVALEQAARRPTGEFPGCKSGFGVSEMHGGVWEWTSSAWGRSSKDGAQGVLRGGNSVAGELVGRCANAIARAPTKKSATMGFRCCAGEKNDAEVKLDTKGPAGITGTSPTTVDNLADEVVAAITANAGTTWPDKPGIDPASRRAWAWTPVMNEELFVVMGCSLGPRYCGLAVIRAKAEHPKVVLVSTGTGRDLPELARIGDARHLRIRALDARGTFNREITYVYGRVELGEAKRP